MNEKTNEKHNTDTQQTKPTKTIDQTKQPELTTTTQK